MADAADDWVDVPAASSAAPAAPANDDGWVDVPKAGAPATASPPTGPQGGLLQTIPQGIEMVGSEEGRAKLWAGIKKFPGDFAQGLVDFVKTPGTAYSMGVTPDQEVEFGLNAALGMIGSGTKIPRVAMEAIAPHVAEFEAGVTRPVAEQAAASEQVISAAVKVNDKIYTGANHLEAMEKAAAELGTDVDSIHTKIDDEKQSQLDAWVTSEGRFVDSKEAARLVGSPHEKLDSLDPEFLQQKDAPPAVSDIVRAKQAGIVGPDIPIPADESPAASAQRAIPAASQPGDKVTMTPAGEPIDAWAERFNRWVDRIDTPEDMKGMIRTMAAESNNFPEARAGNVAPELVAKVAEAAGLEPGSIDAGKLRTTYRTDDEIRTVSTLLKKLGDDVSTAAEAVRGDDSPEALAKFQAAIIKRDYALEATVNTKIALRAEWGRSGNALKEILKAETQQAGLTKLLQDKGRSFDDLRDLARGMNGLDREQAAKVLTGMRGQPVHWLYWTWVQGLISGPVTHAKYVLANAVYAGMERGVVTPMAAILGKAKQLAGADTDRVFFGETAAAHYGTIAAVPDAIKAAYQTIKTGMRAPLESEKQLHDLAIAAGEKPPALISKAVNPVTQLGTVNRGIWDRIIPSETIKRGVGRIVGLPGDSAAAIHTTFKVLGERANLEMWAYNKAAAEGLNPTSAEFWQRRAYHSLNPSEQVLKDTVYQAYKDTFMQELGEHAKNFQQFTKKVPGVRWIVPFAHIPINLMKATYEYSPLAVLDKDMRANILGENGGRAQDLAIARMTVGSSVMSYFVNAYMQGKVTSNYPTDPNERKDWALQQKPANSIQIGDRWVSFERFGPAGDLAQIGAAIGSIAHRFAMDKNDPAKGVDEAFSHAVWATANAAANTLGNEVGFQSLRNFMDAIEDEKKGGSFASYQATSMLPFSSLLTQTASFVDPHMRVAKSMVNGLLYRIPELREGLLMKRDPLYGEPLNNPGYHDVMRSLPVNTDPVKIELERVNLHPTAPRDVIGGVKLTPEQYDRYQATAGPLVQRALTSLVNHPGWQNIQLADRADTLRAAISAMRQKAAVAMQIAEPKLIQQGLQQQLDYASGKTSTPRPKRAPELAAQP
jgi:hypothetical protein